jgi:hypothetical protein
MVDTATAVSQQTVTLRTLHVVLERQDAFMALLKLLQSNALTPEVLKARAAQLYAFDQTLAEVKCYVNLFCGVLLALPPSANLHSAHGLHALPCVACGVKIDTKALSETVQDLTKRYDSFSLKEISASFSKLSQMTGPVVSWLFHLRGSALFLALWRECGRNILNPKREDGASGGKEDAKDDKKKDEKGKGSAADEKKAVSPILICLFSSFLTQMLLQADKKKADAKAKMLKDLDAIVDAKDVTMEQSQVFNVLIPSVKVEWSHLMNSMKTRTISIAGLQKTFATLGSVNEYMSELRVLAATGDGNIPRYAAQRHVTECITRYI